MTNNVSGITLTQAQATQLTTAMKSLSTADQAKITAALADNILTTAEVKDLKGIVAISSIITTIEGGSTSSGTETIDKAKTIAMQKEIKERQDEYNAAIKKESGLKEKIDKANSEFETARGDLTKAVEKMEGAAANAAASVNADVNKILADAKSGVLSEDKAKEKLNAISVPGVSGKLTLNSLQTEVGSLASKIKNLSAVYQDVAKVVGTLATNYGSFLETDVSTICVNTAGKIVINQPGASGPAKTGADGIAALDVAKMASMTTADLATALEGNYKELFDSIKGSGTTALSSTEAANVVKNLIATQNQKGDPSKFGTFGANADVNILNGINKEDLAAAAKKTQDAKTPPKSCDPYEIKIDGKTYQFLKDNGDGKWDPADIFGINDTKDKIFESMKTADLDKNGSVSGEELAKMGIRLVLKDEGKLQTNNPNMDFDLNRIDSINLNSLRSSNQNDGNVGTFGNFDMNLKDGRKIEGKQTFEELSTLQKLFQKVGNGVSNIVNNVKNKFALDPQTVEFYSNLGKFTDEASKIEKESTKISVESVEETIDSTKDNVSSAQSANVGKDPNEKTEKQTDEQKAEPKIEPKAEQVDLKKKKPEETQL